MTAAMLGLGAVVLVTGAVIFAARKFWRGEW